MISRRESGHYWVRDRDGNWTIERWSGVLRCWHRRGGGQYLKDSDWAEIDDSKPVQVDDDGTVSDMDVLQSSD